MAYDDWDELLIFANAFLEYCRFKYVGFGVEYRKIMTFKKCAVCRIEWDLLDEFLQDENIKIIGYQVNFHEPKLGFFLFNHTCNTTIAIDARNFTDLYEGPGYCLHQKELQSCNDG